METLLDDMLMDLEKWYGPEGTEHNDVTAIEPDEDSVKERWADHDYHEDGGESITMV